MAPETHFPTNRFVDLDVALTWRHGLGALDAFFLALEQGHLLAGRCPVCGNVCVPPRVACATDGAATQPLMLPPTGTIVRLTTGTPSSLLDAGAEDAVFAELAIDGADNRLLARIALDGVPAGVGNRVRLHRTPHSIRHPIQRLVFKGETEGARLFGDDLPS